MRSFEWALNQNDWCPWKRGQLGHRDRCESPQGEPHVKTKGSNDGSTQKEMAGIAENPQTLETERKDSGEPGPADASLILTALAFSLCRIPSVLEASGPEAGPQAAPGEVRSCDTPSVPRGKLGAVAFQLFALYPSERGVAATGLILD